MPLDYNGDIRTVICDLDDYKKVYFNGELLWNKAFEFEYSGTYEVIGDLADDFMILLKGNGTFKPTNVGNTNGKIDIFLLGGGGGGYNAYFWAGNILYIYNNKGGHGYSLTQSDVAITENGEYTVTVGGGGIGKTSQRGAGEGGVGGTSSFTLNGTTYSVNGGDGGHGYGSSGGWDGDGGDANIYAFADSTSELQYCTDYNDDANSGNGGAVGYDGGSGIVIIRNHRQ